jgi:hypothetical protein
MAEPKAQATTTLLLLKSHEPECPPSITDAGSQAGQAFNQTLRAIAALPGCDSQLFGWPYQPDSADQNANEWIAAIMPGVLGIFINWDTVDAASQFTLPRSLKQVFQGLTTFFEVPTEVSDCIPEILRPALAVNVRWTEGDADQILRRTKLPLSLSSIAKEHTPVEHQDSDSSQQDELRPALGISADSTDGVPRYLSMRHVLPEQTTSQQCLTFTLLRTRYCSRLREGLDAMIKARRVD